MKLKRIPIYLLRIIGILLISILLIVFLLTIPAVQSYLTDKVENYLENKLETTVDIGAIRLKFPKYIALKDAYIETPQRDTFLHIGSLDLNVTLNGLRNKTIQIDKIVLNDGKANIAILQDSSNFDFILEAFNSNSPKTIKDTKGKTPWLVSFQPSTAHLENVDIHFKDEIKGIEIDAYVGKGEATTDQIDYLENIYQIKNIHLDNTKLDIDLDLKTDTAKTSTAYFIHAESVEITNSELAYNTPNYQVKSNIKQLNLDKGQLDILSDNLLFASSNIEVDSDFLRFDRSNTEKTEKGFDYNHFELEKLSTSLSNIKYNQDSLDLHIIAAKLRDNNDFAIQKIEGKISYSPKHLELTKAILVSKHTQIQSNFTRIDYPFTSPKPKLNQLEIHTDLRARTKNREDFVYIYPEIEKNIAFSELPDTPIQLKAAVKGSLKKLAIQELDFNGWNSVLITEGKLSNILDQASIGFAFEEVQVSTTDQVIQAFLPDSILPVYVQIPDSIALRGSVNGDIRQFNTSIKAKTFRTQTTPSTIKFHGNLQNILDFQNAVINLQIDSLQTTQEDIVHYLPPKTIPEDITLPEKILLRGSIEGPTSKLSSKIQLLTAQNGKENQFYVFGELGDLFSGASPKLNIQLDSEKIQPEDIASFLPDSIFPAYFNLPIIRKVKGIIRGDLDNFKTVITLNADSSHWKINAKKKKDTYDLIANLKDLNPKVFFKENYLDSMIGFQPSPLNISLELKGEKLDFKDKDASSQLNLVVKSAARPNMDGLKIHSTLEQKAIRLQAKSNESEAKLNFTGELDYKTTIPDWHFALELDTLDLRELTLADSLITCKGKVFGRGKGISPDTLQAKITASNIEIRFEENSKKIDSVIVNTDLDNGKNNISILSNLIDAELKGHFPITDMPRILEDHFYSLIDPEHPSQMTLQDSCNFTFYANLYRPSLLTMGWIPKLNRLSAFRVEGHFDYAEKGWSFKTRIPFIDYENYKIRRLSVIANAFDRKVNYKIGIRQALLFNTVDLKHFSTFGKLQKFTLSNTMQILDEESRNRFEISSISEFLPEQLSLSFLDKQLLNYEEWTVKRGNKILISKEHIDIKKWRFRNKFQALSIQSKDRESINMRFTSFDLTTISDIIKMNGNYFKGTLFGNIKVNDLFQQPYLTADLTTDSLKVFDAHLGNLKVEALYDKNAKVNTEIQLDGNGNKVVLSGQYDIKQETDMLNFDLFIHQLNLASLEPLSFGQLKNLTGNIEGKIDILGNLEHPILLGTANFQNTAFDVSLVNTRFKLGNQPILFQRNKISIQNLDFFDKNDNKGIASIDLNTKDYRNFDLDGNLKINDFLLLDTKEEDNDLYYGKLITDVEASIGGSLAQPIFNFNANPKEGSNITYVYSSTGKQIESHDGIVKFIQPKKEDFATKANSNFSSELLNMEIIAKLAINENLNLKVITNPLADDYFEGQLKGDLFFKMFPDETMELNGTLQAVKGKYLFTYQDIIRRPFAVAPNSTLSWTGNPFNPELDLNVQYKVKASTYPLLANEENTDKDNAKRENFVVNINIGGKVSKTDIQTSIQYPTGDGNTNDAYIRNKINEINNNTSQQNTQAFALILFNGFLAEDIQQSKFNGIINISDNLTNVITQQLNNLANQYIKFVDISFGIDANNTLESNSNSLQVSLKKRFLNDRLEIVIDGKGGQVTSNGETNTQTYIDNLTVNYTLTPKGNLKIKVYNVREYDDFIQQTGLRVGGALMFSKSFNRIILLPKKKKQPKG